MKKRRLRITGAQVGQALGGLAIALLLVGCRGPGASPPPSPVAPATAAPTSPLLPAPPPGEADDRRRVRIVIEAEPAHLNPDLDPDQWGFRLAHDAIYEPLWRQRPDGTFEGLLAERFQVEDEGRKLTFFLRPGALFHDGEPVHSTDVAFTFDRLRAGRTHAPRAQALLADLDRIELAGANGVRMWLTRSSATLPLAIAELGILPEHVFAAGDLHRHGANRRPVGSGPFRLKEWERGKRLLFERFQRYWGPPPGADEIVVQIEGDAGRALGQARRGEIDILGHVPPAYVATQLDSPSLRANFETVRVRRARFVFVLWNLAHPPFDQLAVRRAIGLGVDRGKILGEARHGVGRAIVAPTLGGAVEPEVRFDFAAAEAALDGARLGRLSEGGHLRSLLDADGRPRPVRLTLLVPTGSVESTVAGKRVAEALGRLGLATEVVTGDLGVLMLRIKKGMFDAALLAWSGRDDDDLGGLFRSGGGQNFGGYSNREVDGLVDALRRPSSPDERRGQLRRLSAALADDPPALFLYAPEEVYLFGRHLGTPRLIEGFPALRDLSPRARR